MLIHTTHIEVLFFEHDAHDGTANSMACHSSIFQILVMIYALRRLHSIPVWNKNFVNENEASVKV